MYNTPREIPVIFHNGSSYDYHFLIKGLAEEFEGKFECLAENNMCIKVYGLDPSYFLSAPGLAWQACLKKAGVKLELLKDMDMLLMIERVIRGGICHSVHRHAKANNKYMKDYDENKESSYIIYGDYKNLYGWGMSQKLPVDGFE